MIKGLDNFDLLYADKQVMQDFYHGLLGIPFLFEPGPEDDWFALRAGNVSIFFFPGGGSHPHAYPPNAEQNPPGFESIAWEVEDFDTAVATLTERGVHWVGDEKFWEHPSGVSYRIRIFEDPEGNKVHITQPNGLEAHVAKLGRS